MRLLGLLLLPCCLRAVQVLQQQQPGSDACDMELPAHAVEPGWSAPKPLKVLLFWAVGSKPCVMELVRLNLAHIRRFEAASRQVSFGLYMVHYDQRQQAWKKAFGETWYSSNVAFSRERAGLKFNLAKSLLLSDFQADAYDWLWLLDEDADLSTMDIGTLLRLAGESGSPVVGPAVLSPGLKGTSLLQRSSCYSYDALCKLQKPRDSCRFRYSNFVEVSFPLIRPNAFKELVSLEGLLSEKTIWGMDHVWCALLPQLNVGAVQNASCALVDAAPVIHRDFKTMKKSPHPILVGDGWAHVAQVMKRYPKSWINGYETYKCVA